MWQASIGTTSQHTVSVYEPMEKGTLTCWKTVMSTLLLTHTNLYGEGWMTVLRSSFFAANAESTLVQLPESIINLHILPLIVQVERKSVVRSYDSCVEHGRRQLRRKTKA